ncbi:MAG: hypothetical protein A4E49_00012 [Methanosaeta sp. PtaU1.Bin112]|nr:MAG: hypothetical protein A4E49_00012 [Methanosaeta sp. PtaU1.Bin112]
MPITIPQGFQKLKENLEITTLQETTTSERQQNIRDALKNDLNVRDSFLAGSYRRNTMIAPLSEADIDIFVILGSEYFKQDGQAILLDKVKQVLRKTYPKTPDISRNGQAVTIVFSDFRVDVVPAFFRQGGGYLIPDTILKRWISTDPKIHIDVWAKANKMHNGYLVPLIKMMKCWNQAHSAPLRSFHLESLVIQILNNVTISDYPSGIRYVFDKARTQIQYAVVDPAGYGGDIGAYLDTKDKKDNAINRIKTAYERAYDAERLNSAGDIQHAYDKWRLIFGDYFPAYG